jgi:prepilin-type N-terminal cleavage/methylation domain-containing protein
VTARAPRRRSHEAGYTLLELIVASVLASTFAVAMSSVGTAYFKLIEDLRVRTDASRAVNVIRARMIADVKGASDAVCSDGKTLLLTLDDGGVLSQVEYTASAGKLLRWYSVPDRAVALAERVNVMTCTALGERGVELELAVGPIANPSHLYLHLAETLPEGEGT